MKQVDAEILDVIWKMYRRQKDVEADSGLDVDEDISRMREWFRLAAKGEATHEELEHRFGPDPPKGDPRICPKCGGTGWYHSQKARLKRRARDGGYREVEVPGMIACLCPAGEARNRATNKLGKPEPKKRRPAI